MKALQFHFLISILLILCFKSVLAQDIIVRTNGDRIEAIILELSGDSVKFKIYNISGNAVFSLAKSEVKFIDYGNDKIEYFEGSYINSSKEKPSEIITGFEVNEDIVEIEGIGFSVENLFTENHLILDFRNHPDTNFYAEKGKMEFMFENKKYNFTIRIYPTGEKTMFSKFEFSDEGENKRYDYLSKQLLTTLVIYLHDSVTNIKLNQERAEELSALFSGKNINVPGD